MAAMNLTDLATTSRWTAAARARESEREDALFNDPYAAALAGDAGMAWLEQVSGQVTAMVIRTRFFDDYLLRIVQHDGLRQVVILAAGMDTRAYRLDWPPGLNLFEADQSQVLSAKAQVLRQAGAQARCRRHTLNVDLRQTWDDSLRLGGFDPAQPTAWLLEGFLFYLPARDAVRILDEVSALSAPGSALGFDIFNSETLTSPYTRAWVEMQTQLGAPWLGTMDDPEALLADRGWQAALTQPGAPDAHFGRWTLPVYPVKLPNMPHQWLVTARKA